MLVTPLVGNEGNWGHMRQALDSMTGSLLLLGFFFYHFSFMEHFVWPIQINKCKHALCFKRHSAWRDSAGLS